MEQYTFNKEQLEAIMYGYAAHVEQYNTKAISALNWLSKYGPAQTLSSPSPVEVDMDGGDQDLAAEIVARFTIAQGRGGSITKLRKEAFVDGALWMRGRKAASSGETVK